MSLFKKTVSAKPSRKLITRRAKEIYELLKTKDANTLFLEDNIPTEDTEEVEKEIRRLENEVNSKMSGSFELTARIPAELNEEGKIVTKEVPATYFKVTTEEKLKASLESSLLDVSTVVDDIRKWANGNPDEPLSWTEYKASFNSK